MPIGGRFFSFSKNSVDGAPDKHGVYALYEGDVLIYYGRADGTDVSVRSRLQSHFAGRQGRCTLAATLFRYEITESAAKREEELLGKYKIQNLGALPHCLTEFYWVRQRGSVGQSSSVSKCFNPNAIICSR
jgi:hypothetical protein